METAAYPQLVKTAERFRVPGKVTDITKLASGNINDTFFVSTSCFPEKGFILQKMNRRVFDAPEKSVENICLLLEHVKNESGRTDGMRLPWKIPDIVRTHTGDPFWIDSEGNFWRASRYIGNSTTYTRSSDPDIIRQAGLALGRLHCLTNTLDIGRLHIVLAGFHITPRYYKIFRSNLQSATIDKNNGKIRYCLEAIRDMEPYANVLEKAKRAGKLKIRTIHGDPKISNILFHPQQNRPVGIIDLDTVQPGLVHYDIGDCARSCCNRLGEETLQFDQVRFDLTLFQRFIEGYLEQAGSFFLEEDYRHLYDCLRLIAFELGLRFLSDYLAGNRYFRATYREHNLNRAFVQFRLAASIERQEKAIRSIMENARNF